MTGTAARSPHQFTGETRPRPYDGVGNVLFRIDGEGLRTEVRYTPAGVPHTVIDPAGGVTTYHYDNALRVLSATDPRGNAGTYPGIDFGVHYTYDDVGRLTEANLPARDTGSVARAITTFTYDAAGNVTQWRDPTGAVTRYTYSPRHLATMEERSVGAGSTTPHSERTLTTTYGYDEMGNLIERTDPQGVRTSFTYDEVGRRQRTIRGDGSGSGVRYDEVGNIRERADGRGNLTTVTYNLANQPLETRGADGGVTTMGYDVYGNPIRRSVIRSDGTETMVYRWTYDGLNRVRSETAPGGFVRQWTEYDGEGNVREMIDPNGTVIRTEYTERYEIERVDYNGGAEAITYTYDEAGGLMSAVTGGIATTYNHTGTTYVPDVYGRVRELDTTIDGRTYTLDYGYDAADRVTGVTYPTGSVQPYRWDELGRLIAVPGVIEGTTYDRARLTGWEAANATTMSRTYDEIGRLAGLGYQGAEEIADYTFTYDDADNIIGRNENVYAYDAMNRLRMAELVGTFGIDPYEHPGTVGARRSDVPADLPLELDLEQAVGTTELIALDTAGTSIGVDLGGVYEVTRIALTPEAGMLTRLTAEHLRVLVSMTNSEGDWTEVTVTERSTAEDGSILLHLTEPAQARYVKVWQPFNEWIDEDRKKDVPPRHPRTKAVLDAIMHGIEVVTDRINPFN